MIIMNLQFFGGRGSSSRSSSGPAAAATSVTTSAAQNVANQAPSPQNTPVTPSGVTALTQMTDDELAALVIQSKNVDMPNHLADVSDPTQRFVYAAGLNEKPVVLTTSEFDQYLRDNGISRSDIMSRTVGDTPMITAQGMPYSLTGAQIASMTRDSVLNYVGGKHGGQVHGAGTYFDRDGGTRGTGYGTGHGNVTMHGVLSPKAKIISSSALDRQASSWASSHPKTARAIGGYSSKTKSIYALAMGYNVIYSGSYHNVIDRSALVLDASNY